MLTNHLATWWRLLGRRRCRSACAGGRQRAARRPAPRVQALEDRTLLSTGLGGWNALASLPAAPLARTEFIFIDPRVPQASQLAAAALSGTEVHVLNAQQGGLEQIARALAGWHGTADLHILSHGAAGTLELGNSQLTAANLGQHADALHTIETALGADSDLLLYACDASQGPAGQALVRGLAADTGAMVAASTDPTGAAALGGDWTLETTTGTIHAQSVFDASVLTSYSDVLGAPDPSKCIVTVSAPTVQAGSSVVVTLHAVDSSGTPLTTGGDIVTFALASTSASQGTFSAVTDHHNGTYTAVFTGTTNAGTSNTITATINSQNVTSTLPTITVTPGPADPAMTQVALVDNIVQAGDSTGVLVQAEDAYGNPLTVGGDPVTLTIDTTSGTSRGLLSGVTDQSDGTYSATLTGTIAGSATTITATIDSQQVTSALPAFTVIPGPADAAHSTITVSSSPAAAGTGVSVTVQAADQYGNLETSGGDTVLVAIDTTTSTGTAVLTPATDNGDGTYTATITGHLVGKVYLTASLDGTSLPDGTGLPAGDAAVLKVTPGPFDLSTSCVTVSPSGSVAADGATLLTVTLTALDAFGNANPTDVTGVVFGLDTASGTSTGVFGNDVAGSDIFGIPTCPNVVSLNHGTGSDQGNGIWTDTFQGIVAGTPTPVMATINGQAVTCAPPSVTVTPGPFDLTKSFLTIRADTQASGNDATIVSGNDATSLPAGNTLLVTLTAVDQYCNANPTGIANVVFSLNNTTGTSTGVFGNDAGGDVYGILACPTILSQNQGAGTDQGNGIWTDTFQGIVAGTATTLVGSINSQAVTGGTAATALVTPGHFDTANSFLTIQTDTQALHNDPTVLSGNDATSLPAGNTLLVTLTAEDQYCNAHPTGITGVVFSLDTTNGTSTGVFGNDVTGSDIYGIPACPTIVSQNQGQGTDQGNGIWTDTFQGIYAGTASIVVGAINGQAVTGGTTPTALVTPGVVDAMTSQVTIQASSKPVDNDPTQIKPNQKDANSLPAGNILLVTLTGYDQYCNPRPTGMAGVQYALDTASGTSTGVFANDVAGSDVFGIARLPTVVSLNQGMGSNQGGGIWTDTFEGIIAGSKTTLVVTVLNPSWTLPIASTPATVVVTPGAVSAAESLLSTSKDKNQRGQYTTGPNAHNVAVWAAVQAFNYQAQRTFLTILPEDSFCNFHPTNIQNVQFTWDNGLGRTSHFATGVPMPGNPAGTYVPTLDFYSTIAPRTYTITVTINAAPLPSNTNVTVHAVPGQEVQLVAPRSLNNFNTIQAGQMATVVMRPEDFYGNPTTFLSPQSNVVFFSAATAGATIVEFQGSSSRGSISRGSAPVRLLGAVYKTDSEGEPSFQLTIVPLAVGLFSFVGDTNDDLVSKLLGQLTLSQINKTKANLASNNQTVVSTTLNGSVPLGSILSGQVKTIPVYGVSVPPPGGTSTGPGAHRHA